MKNTWSLIIVVTAVLLFLFFLSSAGKKPPLIPFDRLHADLKTNEACLSCHAPGKSVPLKDTHPPKEQCVACHKPGKG
jgi:hypothetical protein